MKSIFRVCVVNINGSVLCNLFYTTRQKIKWNADQTDLTGFHRFFYKIFRKTSVFIGLIRQIRVLLSFVVY